MTRALRRRRQRRLSRLLRFLGGGGERVLVERGRRRRFLRLLRLAQRLRTPMRNQEKNSTLFIGPTGTSSLV